MAQSITNTTLRGNLMEYINKFNQAFDELKAHNEATRNLGQRAIDALYGQFLQELENETLHIFHPAIAELAKDVSEESKQTIVKHYITTL
jgi:hypothetical protein